MISMLRTNTSLLTFIESLYHGQGRKEDVILRSFRKGGKLLEQDVKIEKVFIIKEGVAKCLLTEDNDKQYIFEFLGEGEIVGDIEALKSKECLCTVEALSEVKAYCMSATFFLSRLAQDMELNRILLQELAERVLNTSKRASYQQLYTVEYGLARLIELQEQKQINITKDDMAAYLGITVRSLNRALKRLKLLL